MAHSNAGKSSDLIDPLIDYSTFSFNPSSIFRPLSTPDYDSLASHLINMAVRNPDSLVNQAKSIIDGSKDQLESDKTMATTSEEKSEVPITVNNNKPKENRPGLGLKRAKFSMIPLPSQPDPSLVPELDIDKLSDPVEFFAAYDRRENAIKELRRLRGEPLEEIDLNRESLPPRPVRPSLLGKTATYKHRSYPSVGTPSSNEALISSQEAHDQNIMSQPREDAIPETHSESRSPHTRVSDVKPAMRSKLSELDELLSYDYEGLDDVAVQNLLQDKLNIKVIDDISEPSIFDLPVVRRREYESFVDTLPNMNDTIFNGKDSSKASTSKPINFSYHFAKSSTNQVSPSLHKSPLASISIMNKRISRLTPLKDPFSTIDIDSSPEVVSYSKPQNREQADQIDQRIDSHEISRSSVNQEEINKALISRPGSAGNIRYPNVESEELFDGVANNDPLVTSKDPHDFGRSSAHEEEDTEVSGEILLAAKTKHIATGNDSKERLNEIRQISQTSTMENLFETRSTIGEDNLEVLNEVSVPVAIATKDVDTTSVPMEEENQISAVPEFVGNEVFSDFSAVEKASVNGDDGEMGEPLNTQGILIEKPDKKIDASFNNRHEETEELIPPSQENIDEETVNKGRKRKAKSKAVVTKEPKNKKKKAVDEQLRRHSLYGAGTKWEEGLRRSTRIRMRPLEFWKGERFLYGRVHESLVSVIGVKYASPGKNAEKAVVKVKSFVSDKYKNLLDLASSY